MKAEFLASKISEVMDNERLQESKSISFLKKLRIGGRSSSNSGKKSSHPKSRKSKKRKVLMVIGFLCGLCLVMCIGLYSLFQWYDAKENIIYDDYDKVLEPIINWTPSDNTLIRDKEGSTISEEFSKFHKYINLEEIPEFLIKAVIAIEDRRYYDHPGVDVRGIARAMYSAWNKSGRFKQGGSTITQQLVRNFVLGNEKTIKRKLREFFLAIELEKRISKQKILEIYLNQLFLGNGSYGVGAASRRYFNKNLPELSRAEMALIAGLFQSPSLFNPEKNLKGAVARQRQVINALVAIGVIDKKQADEMKSEIIKVTPWNRDRADKNLWFINFVITEAKKLLGVDDVKNLGLVIETTLDPFFQDAAYQAIQDQAPKFDEISRQKSGRKASKKEIEASLLAVDPRDGQVLAMIGGRNPEASDFNRAAQSLRSPGSLFKPIVYSLAIDSGFKWSDVFYVSPVQLPGNYRPKAIASDYYTETTMIRAMYRSMNTPIFEIAEVLGMEKISQRAKALGVVSPIKNEFGSVLGQSEVTMIEMAQVYGNFVNQGLNYAPTAIRQITNREGNILYELPTSKKRAKKALSPETAFLVYDGLKKVLQLGTGSRAGRFAKYAGGKTGTTNDSKDNWFAGVTSDLVGVSWVGFDQPTAIEGDAQGATLALPVWENFMDRVSNRLLRQPPPRPSGLKDKKINPQFGHFSESGIEILYRDSEVLNDDGGALDALYKLGSSYRGFGTK